MEKIINQLFQKTQIAFDKSPIKAYAKSENLSWNYSIAATQLNQNANVIIGFNWGVSGNEEYETQTEIPSEDFKDLYDKKWLGSLQRIYSPLKKYFPTENIDKSVQTNFCFFRSKEERQITASDLELSTPLFEELMEIIQPKRIIGFSSKLRDHFIANKIYDTLETARIPSNNRTIFVAKGAFQAKSRIIPFFFLPHPNAKFTGEARENAWKFCFDER